LELTGVVVSERFIPNLVLTFKLIPDPDKTFPFILKPEPAQILVEHTGKLFSKAGFLFGGLEAPAA
jgi:hypothetical protein